MKFREITISSFIFLLLSISANNIAQERKTNYDENLVPAYTLPDPLVLQDGNRVKDVQTWWKQRRSEILQLYQTEVYGKTPSHTLAQSYQLISEEKNALKGKAIRKEIKITFAKDDQKLSMILLIYLPKSGSQVPVFLGLNFDGNQAITSDTGVTVSEGWEAEKNPRGVDSAGWPVERIIERGYGIATIYYGDIDPDFDDGFKNGIHPFLYRAGQVRPGPDEWGSIGAWAWGLSRAMDYLETDKMVNPRKVIVFGHSRLGKTALWAGAQDQRFAEVISNNSGCGGAALSKRAFGETVMTINTAFPHWFCDNFNKYNDRESLLPVDQHMLIALIAPRPVYIASAQDDLWADPKGEFLGGFYASDVYKLLGTDGMSATAMPPLNTPVMSTIGYHIRPGKHAITKADWEFYLNYTDKYIGTDR
jgi:hypothetical protein